MTLVSCRAHPDYERRTLAAVAESRGTSAVAAFIDVVKSGGAGIVCKAMQESDIRTFYQQKWVMVGSDGGIGMRHPRAAGTFPRVLGRYVRELGWLSLEEAVRKMTSAPAARLKLADRGVIRQGVIADIVVFDPARIRDRATFTDPFALSTGVEKVLVNGELAWSEGRATGDRPGRALWGPCSSRDSYCANL